MSFLTAPQNVRAAERPTAKNVLIISGGSRLAPGFAIADQYLLEALGAIPSVQVETYAENIDLVRFPAERSERIFTEYLTGKYAENPPDLIILVYVSHLEIMTKTLTQVFPRVPIIVAGFSEERLRAGQFGSSVIGFAQRVNPGATLELIRRLQPNVRRVVVVTGTAETDRLVLERVKEAGQKFKPQLEFEFWDNLTLEELRRRLGELPQNAAVLFGRFFRDAAGEAVISSQMGRWVVEWANAPVYVMTATPLGTGAVGGSVISVESFAKRAGELARLVLTGTDVRSLSFEVRSDSAPMFDWRALNRWSIPESRLPPGSVVRFKPASIWQQYSGYLLVALAIIAVQSAIIADLLSQRTRRRRAEENLSESRQFMELATEAGGIGLWVRDLVRGTLWVNPRLRSLLGVREAETLTVDEALSRVHPDNTLAVASVLERAQRTGEAFEVEFRTIAPAVPNRWVVATGRFVLGPKGEPVRRMGTMVDITARKEAEEKLWESEERFRRLVETTAAVIWQADIETWMFTYVGPQAAKLLGYPLEQWYEKDFWLAHIHADDREQAMNTCMTLSRSAREFDFEYRMVRSSGEIVWIHDFVNCQDHNGKRMLRGLMLDITERKTAEVALRESEERFRSVANSAPVMIWMSGVDTLCTFFNKGWLDFTGRELEQELGDGWMERVHKQDLDRWYGSYRKAFDARREYTLEYRLRRHDGIYRWVVSYGVPRLHADGTFLGYIGTVIDMTERKQAEDALNSERRFLRQIIDVNPNLIFAKDGEGRFTLANRAVADIYGTTPENMIGKTDADFNAQADEVDFFLQIDSQVIETSQECFIPEERITDAQGKVRWVQTVKRPITNPDGSVHQVLGTSTDITQRKATELELREQRAELAHVSRISTMGELAASLAHELNQPLTAILSNAQAALRFLSVKNVNLDDVREILRDIVNDNSRAGEVIRRMRALVKKGELEFISLDLASVIRDVVVLVHSDAILLNIELDLVLTENLPAVRGDKVQLQQVVLNLLLNAFDAMKESPASERQVKLHVYRNGAGLIEAAVRDRGTGLSGDKLDKIFQPFYTTKGEGLGMGLSICRSIIEAHGGNLWAENNPDRGATFYFTVPMDKADEALAASVVGVEGREISVEETGGSIGNNSGHIRT